MTQGGVAPNRLDFNGLLRMMTEFSYWQQSGGQFAWDVALNYAVPALVYHAGKLWWCLAENGPDNAGGVVEPGTDPAVWEELLVALSDQFAEGGGGELPDIFGGGDNTPVGTIIMFYGTTAPVGYLACNGSAFSATDYPKLYQVLGKAIVPDLRGCFVRGLGGASAGLGVVQQDAGRNVTGGITDNEGHGAITMQAPKATGAFSLAKGGYEGSLVYQGNRIYDVSFDASKCWGTGHVANEFRPVNVALLYCVKHD
jgi:hypothetical protein